MKEDKRITERDIEEAEVRFKPIFGIAPNRYIGILYTIVLLFILFLLLLYPGIKNPGSVYHIQSDPPNSAVFLDGSYTASTPAKIFLPAGTRQIRIEHPLFIPKEVSINARAKLLGTMFFTREEKISFSLVADKDADTILAKGIKEYSWWAMTGQPSEAYQIPMVLSEAALAWTAIPASNRVASKTKFVGAALSYTGHAQSARDAFRAAALVSGESATITPTTLGNTVRVFADLLTNDPAVLPALLTILPPDIKATIESTSLYTRHLDSALKASAMSHDSRPTGRTLVAGMDFIKFDSGSTSIITSTGIPAVITHEAFALASTETTVKQYREFLAENPQWAFAAIEVLRKDGLVDAAYLKDFDSADPDHPVRYVSRPAAEAYAQWLSSRAPSDSRFSLPTEAQWNRAASTSALLASRPDAAALFAQGRSGPSPVSALKADFAGFKGLLGSVWEWCADPYSVHPGTNIASRILYPGYDGLVRGGSWANRADLVDLDSRGPMTPSACNAYTGFRLVMVPVQD